MRGLAIRIDAARTSAMTIHMVRIVELMLGYQVTRPVDWVASVRDRTTCGAGNYSVPWMKQAGYGQASPGPPSFGNGGNTMNAAILNRMTAPKIVNHFEDNPRPALGVGCGAGAPTTSSVASCSLDTLLHTQERGVLPRSSF